jgi:hypothetical protein
MDRLVIIESPYAGDVAGNVAYARAALRDSLGRGEYPIASHLLYTQPGVLNDDIPAEREWGINAGLAWRQVAQKAVFYTDRGWSSGMLAAREIYEREGHPFEERQIGLVETAADPNIGAARAELVERLKKLQDARRRFVLAREAMNAARPDPITSTRAEYVLWDECCAADREAEHDLHAEQCAFATWAADNDIASVLSRSPDAADVVRLLRGWLRWYLKADGDDDCEYLNDKGWDDAEALASSTIGAFSALQAQPAKDGVIERLRAGLEQIANARTAMDGGSIAECRRKARALLEAEAGK